MAKGWRKPRTNCPICGKPAARVGRKYCGNECANQGRSLTPNAGWFIAGETPVNRLPLGTVTIRQRHNREEGPRAWVKVEEPNVWRPRALVVWEDSNGPIPDGMIVHHENRDTLDDRLDNLGLLDRRTHINEHREEFEQVRKERAIAANTKHGNYSKAKQK